MKTMKDNIVLLHGVFNISFIKELKKRDVKEVYLLEGRPSLKAAKEFSKSLLENKIIPVLIADNMAGFLFFRDLVKEVWISYQEENKEGSISPIGALILGVLAKQHGIPVYIFPSEEKLEKMGQENEIFEFNGVLVAPERIKGYVPLLESLPKKYITQVYN